MLIPRGKLIQDNLATSYVLLEPLVGDLREGGFSGLVEIVLRQTDAFIVFDGGNVAAFLERLGNDWVRVTLDELAEKSRNERGRVLIYAYPPVTAGLIAARVNAHSLYDAVSSAVTDPARLLEKLAREVDREWFVEVHCANGTSSLICVGEGLCCVIEQNVESDAEPFDSTNLGDNQKLGELFAQCQSFGATLSVSFLRADEAARPVYVEVKPHIATTPDDSQFETSSLAEVDIRTEADSHHSEQVPEHPGTEFGGLEEMEDSTNIESLSIDLPHAEDHNQAQDAAQQLEFADLSILHSAQPRISEDSLSQVEESESYLDLSSAKPPELDAQEAVSELRGTLDPAGVDDFDFDKIQPSDSSDWIDESTLETVEDQSVFEGYQIDAREWGSMPDVGQQPEGEAIHHQTGEAAEAVTTADVLSLEASTNEVESPAASLDAASPEASIPEAASSEAPTPEVPTLETATLETALEAPTPEAPTLEAADTDASIPETAIPEDARPEAAIPEPPTPESVSAEAAGPGVHGLAASTPDSAAGLENILEAHDSIEAVTAESAELTLEPNAESESEDNTPASIPAFLIEPDNTKEEDFDETDVRDEIVRLDDYPEPAAEHSDADAALAVSQVTDPGVEIESSAIVTIDDRIEAESQLNAKEESDISKEAGEVSVSEIDENAEVADAGGDADKSEPVVPREPLASLADDIRELTAAELTAPDMPLDTEIADDLADVKRLMAELCRTIDEAAQGVGKPDSFSLSLRAGQINVADDFPFLDPFAGEFEYLAGEIVFVGEATADEFIEGLSQALMFAIRRVMKTTSYPERFRAYLSEDLRKLAVRNESEFERLGLDGIITRLLDGERASATGS